MGDYYMDAVLKSVNNLTMQNPQVINITNMTISEASLNLTYDFYDDLCQNNMQSIKEGLPGYTLCMHTLLPIICMFGIIGIILTLTVLIKKSMSTSTNNYLISQAVADLLFLVVIGVRIFDTRLERVTHHYYLVIMTYGNIFINIFLFASVWLTVMLTVERYIAICHPLRAMTICTVVRARIIIISIIAIATLYHVVWIFRYKVEFHWDPCVQRELPAIIITNLGLNKEFRHVSSWADCCLFAIAPVILVLVLNILLILEIHRSTKYLQHHMANDSNVRTIISKEEMRITRMLIMVVIVSGVCQGPYIVLNIYKRLFLDVFSPLFNKMTYATILFLVLRSSFNFIIYCWFSEKFWSTLKRSFCVGKCKKGWFPNIWNNKEHGQSNNNRNVSIIHTKETTC
ncbi:thyrotropin-releasing hormone receptor-like [Dreissena polymorpha]|nr:thyrotropin-releasing hormone receptor-like [Dreissena polymorpha]